MKSRKNVTNYMILLILAFLVQIKGNKDTQRRLQNTGVNNYIEIYFHSGFETDTCWYTQLVDKISSVSVNYNQVQNFPTSFTITDGESVQIYFNSNLNDLSYFLSYNEDLPEEDIPTECKITEHFKSHIETMDLERFDVSEVTSMANMFKGCSKLTRIFFPQNTETTSLTTTYGMFSGCSLLTEFDINLLNTHSVTDMGYMFSGCSSLETFEFSNFDISSVTNMEYMFSECTALKSIYIDNKDSSNLQNVQYMFNSCTSMEYARIANINSNIIDNMDHMFYNCIALTSIELVDIKTFNVDNMNSVFEKCSSLKVLDLSYITTEQVTSMNNIFADCTSLLALEIPNFQMQKLMEGTNTFKNVNKLRYVNIQSMVYNNDEDYNDNTCVNHDCNLPLNYNTEKHLIVCQNHKFISNANIYEICCSFDIETDMCNSFKYIILYFKRDVQYANGFLNDYRNNINFINYNEETLPLNLELNIVANTPLEIHFTLDEITSMEKFFSNEVDNNMANLLSIDFSNFYIYDIENFSHMFYGCSSLEILDLSNFGTLSAQNMDGMFYNCNSLKFLNLAYFEISSTTSTNEMFYGLENLIFINLDGVEDEGQFSSSYLNTMQKEFYVCQETEIISNPKAIECCDYNPEENTCPESTEQSDKYREIMDIYNDIVDNIFYENFDIINGEYYKIQLSKYQTQLTNTMLSVVNLGECEEKLRQQEGLIDDDQFLMIKLDLINTTINATYVSYDIFKPRTYEKVDLDICKDIPIKITVPLTLDESTRSLILNLKNEGYNIFDLKDKFYNDVCSTYTAQNGADIVLSSRKTLIYDPIQEIYFCQSGCEFSDYDVKANKVDCNCKVQKSGIIDDLLHLKFDKTKFVDSFYKVLYNSNFRVLKCIKLLFSIKGIKANYGFYSLTILSVVFIACIIIHAILGQNKIINIINNIIKLKENKELENNSEDKHQNILSIKDDEKKIQNPPKKLNLNKFDENKDSESKDINPINIKTALKKRNSKQFKNAKSNKAKINNIVLTKQELNEDINPIATENKLNKENINDIIKESEIKEKNKDLIDEEINDLDYETALIIDKRTFWQYYISLLKRDHLIIFTFITNDDFNLRQIKILLFIISFSIYFSINAFFFYDDTMNSIYQNNAEFDILFQIPQIIYSSLISVVFNIILNKLSLSESQILDLKKEKNIQKFKQKANSIIKKIKIKLIIFLILSSCLMLFCWYFVSCFCAVYQNTQSILIQDTVFSFLMGMLYPFLLDLFPGFFRIPALRAPNKDMKCNYKISKILNLL